MTNTDYGNAYITVEVSNNTNAAMPTTGGAGTTALLAFGALAFLGTGVILFSKKRMYNAG